jgi:hypothetical protein
MKSGLFENVAKKMTLSTVPDFLLSFFNKRATLRRNFDKAGRVWSAPKF